MLLKINIMIHTMCSKLVLYCLHSVQLVIILVQHKIKIKFMKLLERNQMYDTRFSQSFGDFGTTKNKMLATTRNSFSSRAEGKLPTLNRSFSYSNAKNAKQKVTDLDEGLQDLSKKLHELKLQTRVQIH